MAMQQNWEMKTFLIALLWMEHMSCTLEAVPGSMSGAEKRLFLNITSGYNYISRPVRNGNTQVRLQFGVSLNQILDLDEKHQILTTYVWIYEKWVDQNIHWSPADFDGLDRLMFPAINLWVPDIYIFNVAGSSLDGFVNVTGSYVVVSHEGLVQWSIPLLIKSACSVDVTFFPYDKQMCEIHFGSWIYDISQIDIELDPSELDLSQYVLNNEFDLLETNLSKKIVDGSCCPGNGDHPMVIFKVKMKRKTLYYDYIVVAPTINLCVLTLATFLLPCECGWKIAIGLTVFLTLYVLQLLIAENVPDTNSTPLIGVFLLLVMTLNCVSLIMATIVMNIKKRAHLEPIPNVSPFLLYICENYLSKIICTHLTDWKKIASMRDEIVASGIQTVSIIEQLDHAAGTSCNPTVRNSKEEGSRPIRRGKMERTTTAESSFSCTSANDTFIRELPYTERLLTPQNGDSACRKESSTNDSYVADEDGGLYLEAEDGDAGQDVGTNSDSNNLSVDDFTWSSHRKRESYRMAVRGNNLSAKRMPRRVTSFKRQSILSGAHMKYQWYFVADVIDKTAFLLYFIVMFFGVLTVLLIVPAFN